MSTCQVGRDIMRHNETFFRRICLILLTTDTGTSNVINHDLKTRTVSQYNMKKVKRLRKHCVVSANSASSKLLNENIFLL